MLTYQVTARGQRPSGHPSVLAGSVRRQPVLAKAARTLDQDPVFGVEKAVAYLEPVAGQGPTDCSPDGTDTHYFDADYMRDHFIGVMQLTNMSAGDLQDADAWAGLSDVYIQATIGDSSSKSETAWNAAAPAWKHDMNLWVQKGEENSSLVLSLWDEDLLNRADPLGSVTVQLSTLKASTKTDFHLPLTGTGNSGCVKFSATFLPFGDVAGGEGEKFLEEVDNMETKLASGAPNIAKEINEALATMGVAEDVYLTEAWDAMCTMYDGRVFAEKKSTVLIACKRTGTQVWISRDEQDKKVVIAFRGTDRSDIKDILVDIDLRQAEVNLGNTVRLNPFQRLWNMTEWSIVKRAGPAAHKGFYRSWESVRSRVLRCVDNCTGGDPEWEIICTGHSLGGALAVLCAFELEERGGSSHPVTMYNFGAPRVGNEAFKKLYNVKDSWRVRNEDDVVPKIPDAGLLGYCHVGTGVRIAQGQKSFMFDDMKDCDLPLHDGSKFGVGNVWGILAASATGMKSLLKQQREVRISIFNGKGIAAHMEDSYVAGLGRMIAGSGSGSKIAAEVAGLVAKSREAKEPETEAE